MKKTILTIVMALTAMTAQADTLSPSGAVVDLFGPNVDFNTSVQYPFGSITDVHANGLTAEDYANEWNAHFGGFVPIDPSTVSDQTTAPDENFSIVVSDILADLGNIHVHEYAGGDPANPVHTLPGVDLVPDVSPVPIPAAVWLFMSGLIGLVGVSRRKTV